MYQICIGNCKYGNNCTYAHGDTDVIKKSPEYQ